MAKMWKNMWVRLRRSMWESMEKFYTLSPGEWLYTFWQRLLHKICGIVESFPAGFTHGILPVGSWFYTFYTGLIITIINY